MAKVNNLSKDVVSVMQILAKNEGLVQLLVNDISNPFSKSVPSGTKILLDKIAPFPFDIESTTEDGSFIRVYYNKGEFNENEIIQEMGMHIDIVVAKNLWLINDGERSLIRPYEIMDRVIDLVGQRSFNGEIKLNFSGWQHLAVNRKFDAIRLYADFWNVETDEHF